MDHFATRPGAAGAELWCEDVALSAVAAEVGTPFYAYSSATLTRHFTVFQDAFLPRRPLIAYAVKANPSLAVLRTLAKLGAGADTVSEGEIRRAITAGVAPERIVFSGIGKTAAELVFALDIGVGEINVESEPELQLIARLAAARGARPRIAFRVNPDIGAGAHAKISTGRRDAKFGVSIDQAERLYAQAASEPALHPVGVACHIGSQIADLAPLERAFQAMRGLVERLRSSGHTVERLDLGGGLGAPYGDGVTPASPADFAAMVLRVVDGLDVALAFEPGRMIAANAGVLVAAVLHVHARPDSPQFLVVDAAMNDLIRPAMYDAHHAMTPVRRAASGLETTVYDVVGPVCETSDTFARGRPLPTMNAGDLLAFLSAGAYGASMSSEYNSRLLVPEVLVRGDRWAVTRPRPTYDDMLARERLPDWL